MKEKTNEPKPMVVLHYSEDSRMEIYALDEGDSMAWNNSTNYDSHMSGPSLVFKRVSKSGGREITEYYVNDFEEWGYIDQMMQLGMKYLDEHPDFNLHEFRQELQKKRAEYPKHVSHHKKQ